MLRAYNSFMFDLIVRAKNMQIGIEAGKIVSLEPEILQASKAELNFLELEAVPAVIDSHVHFNEPGHEDWEGIQTGSSALAAGGGTVFIDMPLNSIPVTTTKAALETKLECLASKSVTDYAVWGGLTPDSLPHLEELAAGGVIGFKAFMSGSGLLEFNRSDNETLLEGMRIAATLGLPVAVHAESERITSELTRAAMQQGKTGIRDYLETRPIEAELEAIQNAIDMAIQTRCALHIVHISSAAGVELVTKAKADGVNVTNETCPHYLWFSATDLERLGAVLKCAPPIRSQAELEKLWDVFEQINTIGSDHSPAPPSMKTDANFFKIWGGISGVQSTLEVMLTAIQTRKIALADVYQKLSTNPAGRFGLGNKGELKIGFDADLALVQIGSPWTLEKTDLKYRHAQSPYIEETLTARVKHTLLRGKTIWDGQHIHKTQVRHLRKND
jgi:allantoinase